MPSKTLTTKITVIAIAIAVLSALLSLILVFFVRPPEPGEQDVSTETDISQDADLSEVILPETEDAGMGYIDSIIFLGDSTTYHMLNREVLSGGKESKQVWTAKVGYLNLDSKIKNSLILYPDTNEEMTIAQAVEKKKPTRMVITLGIDYGVRWLSEEEFFTYYGRLVESIQNASPNTTIILQSIFPVSKEYEEDYPMLTNTAIDNANRIVQRVAAAYGIHYLDTASILKGSDNAMLPEYNMGDGLHYTAAAYREILQYIRTHAYGN